MTGFSPPSPARSGRWALHCCVTAACTRCGTVPLDEATGLTPHFSNPAQARVELSRDWGWHLTTRSGFADDDELLCPPCASAANPVRRAGTAPRGQETGHQPDLGLPANARVFPAPREGD